MKILLILLFHVICVRHGIHAISINTLIDDLEIFIDECAMEGFQVNPRFTADCHLNNAEFLNRMHEDHHRLCRMAYKVSCLQNLEDRQCLEGVKSAKKGVNCQKNTHISEKCCTACKIGLELKKKTSECFFTTEDIVKNITFQCCNQGYGIEFSSYETGDSDENAIITQNFETLPAKTDLAPEALTAYQNPAMNSITDCSTPNICGDDQNCVNNNKTDSGYECICKSGFFTGKNSECIDVDECENNPCLRERRTCLNTPGSFKCNNCLIGFENSFYRVEEYDDENVCVDIDECAKKIFEDDEVCTNVEGSFRRSKIKCPRGYVKANATSCKLASCSGRICHKLIQFFFKTVSPASKSKNLPIHEFSALEMKPKMDTEYFEIFSNKGKHTLTLKKPIKEDMNATLYIINGRMKIIQHVHVFVSEY